MIYIPLIALIASEVSRIFLKKESNKATKILRFLSIFVMITIIITRYGIGSDYFSYKHIYESITKANISNAVHNYNNLELGYIALNWISVSLKIPYHYFAVGINLFSFFILLKWVFDNSEEDTLNLSLMIMYSLFFIVWILSTYRQALPLVIVLYLFYNRRISYSYVTKIITILMLSLLHRSVLVIFAFDFLSLFIRSRKTLLIFFGLCLMFPLLPWDQLKGFIEFLPFSNRILHYTNFENLSLLKFSTIIRLSFASLFILTYNELAKSESIRKLLNYYVIGTGLYLLFQFSELTSARLSIYSFITLIVLLPLSVKALLVTISSLSFKKIKLQNIINQQLILIAASISIIMFSSLSLVKDINALGHQIQYTNNLVNPFNYPNIFNKQEDKFKSKFGFISNLKSMCIDSYEEHSHQIVSNKDIDEISYEYTNGDSFTSVYLPEILRYVIINQRGEIAVGNSFNYDPNVTGVLYEYVNLTASQQYVSYPSIDPNFNLEKKQYLQGFKNQQLDIDSQIIYISKGDTIYGEGYEPILEFLDLYGMDYEISSIHTFTRPIEYRIVNLVIESNQYYLLLDSNKSLVVPQLLTQKPQYDANGFIEVETICGSIVINSDYEPIWFTNTIKGGLND